MTDLDKGAADQDRDAIVQAANLLAYYSFDLGNQTIAELIANWLRHHSPQWIRSAVIEALYQGRYKAISVEQILAFWQRRNQPLCHFNHEFERLVCNKFPRHLVDPTPLSGLSSLPPAAPSTGITALPPTYLPKPNLPGQPSSPQGKAEGLGEVTAIDPPSPQMVSPQTGVEADSGKDLGTSPAQVIGETGQAEWPTEAVNQPINQFTPAIATPDFYTKLRAAAQDETEEDWGN